MKYIFTFEKLNVWVLSKDLTVLIYQTTCAFPESEKYGLVPQMQRAAISVSSNIAEGNSRRGKSDRIKFFNIAFSSLMEIISQSIIAFELGILEVKTLDEIRLKGSEISNKLISMMNNQQSHL